MSAQPRTDNPNKDSASTCVTAIVLAAGRSRRFGAENKLLAEINGKPVIQQTIENLVAADISNLLVVTGHDSDRVEALCRMAVGEQSYQTAYVSNDDFDAGMSTSLKSAITHVLANEQTFNRQNSDNYGALICLADMPSVQTSTYNALLVAMEKSVEHSVVSTHDPQPLVFAPVFNQIRGNPVLIKQNLYDMILDIEGDTGARQLLDKHSAIVQGVPVNDRGILIDIDTQDDLQPRTSDVNT